MAVYLQKNWLLLCGLVCLPLWHKATAQDGDLLSLLGAEKETERVTNAFKSPRVINSHSIEMLSKGTMDFRILHRFGKINEGFYELFGLDQASMRMGFDFGLTPNLMVGIGRSTVQKEMDVFAKYRILWQSTGKRDIPISLVWVSGVTRNGLKEPFSDPDVAITFARRLSYYHAVLIGRKFSERFTLQLEPTLVHRNIVNNQLIPNDLYALGIGGRYKITKRVGVNWDYSYAFNRFPNNITYNPLSIGFDIETGGHVFQLHFSNATGMNERAYLSESNGDWLRGAIQFGFNLSRVFQLKKQKVE